MDVGITAVDYPELLSSRLTIKDGRAHPGCRRPSPDEGWATGGSACLRRGRGRQVGDGRNKSPFLLCRGNAAQLRRDLPQLYFPTWSI